MAYAVVISLKQTIHRLLNSPHTSVVSSSREILESAYKHTSSLQQLLKELYDSNNRSSSGERWNALDVQIKEAAQKVEDLLESNVSNHFLSLQQMHGDLDFEEARTQVNSFVELTKKMVDDYTKESDEGDDDDDGAAAIRVSSNLDICVNRVGLSNEFMEIKDHLLKPLRPFDFGVFSLVGKVGSCRTIAAKTLFDELYVGKEQPFDCGAWVSVGRNCELKEMILNILAQIDGHGHDHDRDHDHSRIIDHDVEKLGEYLHASLKGRKYMIVVDDIDEVEVWDFLRRLLPEQDDGSLILITTGLVEVAQFARSLYIYEMPTFLNDRYIWDHLRIMMFGVEDSIHRDFERSGKKIAENCRGSRIALAKVILFLFKTEKEPENWSKLAAEEQNPVFMVDDELLEICKIKEEDELKPEKKHVATSVVDMSPCINIIKDYLFPKRHFPKMEIISFYGMAGIGKTALIRNIFEDSSISHHFNHCVWITLGPKYKSKNILVDILAQIYRVKEDSKSTMDLTTELSYKRCLIVLDDMWNQEPVHHLKTLLPNIKGTILVTTRLLTVGLFGSLDRVYDVRLLNKEESWDLLRQKVFVDDPCPLELEKVGKKISKNCEGLPLLILTIANFLSKAERTLEYWNMVAKKPNSIFMDAYDQILKVLYPSYDYLPQHLKACFLYIGVFPQNDEISASKLIKLWVAEGFLEPDPYETVDDFAVKCLKELVERSLVMVLHKGSDAKIIKTCSLHSVIWHLCNSEALKSKFFHVLSICVDNSIEESFMGNQRMCIRNNVLLGIKDVHNIIASAASNSRSFLCTGPSHEYPVPISFRLRLLRVLDALSIRFYEFPNEAVELIHLRYLALNCNEKLPPSISKLCNLENLIVTQHWSIKSSGDSLFLPMEIWSMKKLKYLRAERCNMPNPNNGDVLANLSTLLDVSIESCGEDVLKGVPNLKKLRVQIELVPGDIGRPFHYLNNISCLNKLESLKCVVVNPDLSDDVVTPLAPYSMFPLGLKKLSLSGLGYPWRYMSIIGRLQNLEVLKLRCYAFQGPMWETEYASFSQLKYLLIEDTDLVCWRVRNPSFFSVKYLKIKNCYMLEKLLYYLPYSVEMVEVVDCNPSVVTWAEQMKEMDWERKLEKLTVLVESSWDDRNLK